MELAERFWSSVDRRGENECWLWTRGCNARGYGVFYLRVGEFGVMKCTPVIASRMSFFLQHGRWPEPQALHGCDNPPCCNSLDLVRESHVHEGTQAKNLQEAYARGRKLPPPPRATEEWSGCRLTLQQVAEIRALYSAGGVYQYVLAAQFGVGQSQISRIVRGEDWTSCS